jgi:hypothetical protein
MGHALTIHSIDELKPYFRALLREEGPLRWKEEQDGILVCSVHQASARFRPVLAVGLSAHQVESFVQVTAGRPAGQGTPALVVVPSLSSSAYEACRARGLSCADLNGRMFLQAVGFLVERPPKVRRFRGGLPVRRLFAGRACRLARALLSQPGVLWTIRDLAREAQLSIGTVQSLLVAYHRDGLVAGRHGDWRLSSPDPLLDAWRAADRWERRVTETWFRADVSEWRSVCRQIVVKLGRETSLAFTQFAGAGLRCGSSAIPRISFYTTAAPAEVGAALEWRPGWNGSEILVLTPEDPAISNLGRNVEGLPVCGDGQIYVDLVAAGPDQAADAAAFRHGRGFLKPVP